MLIFFFNNLKNFIIKYCYYQIINIIGIKINNTNINIKNFYIKLKKRYYYYYI